MIFWIIENTHWTKKQTKLGRVERMTKSLQKRSTQSPWTNRLQRKAIFMQTEIDFNPASNHVTLLVRFEHRLYWKKGGELLYLETTTFPVIFFAINALLWSVYVPTVKGRILHRQILQLVSWTTKLGPQFSRLELNFPVKAYTDADWAGCKRTRQSTTGFIASVNKTLVSWKSTWNSVLVLSSAEKIKLLFQQRPKSWRGIYAYCRRWSSKNITDEIQLSWELNFSRTILPLSLYPVEKISILGQNTFPSSFTGVKI